MLTSCAHTSVVFASRPQVGDVAFSAQKSVKVHSMKLSTKSSKGGSLPRSHQGSELRSGKARLVSDDQEPV